MFHLGPSCFCQCQTAGIGHICHSVNVLYCFSPKCSHYSQNVCLFCCGFSVSRIKLIACFECSYRHSPVIKFRKISFELRIIQICKFSRSHNQRVTMLLGQFLASWRQSVSPAHKCYIFRVREQIIVGRHANVI